ncbi:MAG: TIGR04282 family arsenosugar biosynthesis glycosyltransferase [Gammaproteobacteria bacterium]|nr:TIGR04282 family arsenosugar biosynthesis glycosyltransferase [Gammaproteobacteria bacterium]
MKPENLLIIFARPPVPGKTKTRLIPELGATGAASLYTQLLSHTLAKVSENNTWDIELCMADRDMPQFVQQIAVGLPLQITYQHSGDLGERMFQALKSGLARYQKVSLIGTDCPLIDSDLLQHTFALLNDVDLVFSPAEDGGYVQIAARKIQAGIFEKVEWGSAEVMAQTRKNILHSGLSVAYGDVLWDVDTPQDLARYYAFANDLPVV